MEYEPVIGLEVHVQLQTKSKMFCGCPANYQDSKVNSIVCPVCLGLPGALPVINSKAVEYTVMTGLALHCRIPEHSKFDRKNYPYPDLMKGYQISQFDMPLAVNGNVTINVDGVSKQVRVDRVHLEEDAAKLQHHNDSANGSYSLVDVNRAGVPLMEIVSEPDMCSSAEARAYLTTLHSIVQYLGVSAANMQEGHFRCDANVSLRPKGNSTLGVKAEVKNMNSFRSVYMAINYEIDRQARILEQGGKIVQETRGWIDDREVTVSQRSKEQAHDYRYFPDPDLPPLTIKPGWVERIRESLPELAEDRKRRFMKEHNISEYDAELLTSSKAIADYYNSVVDACTATDGDLHRFAKQASNWILGDVTRLLNANDVNIDDCKITPDMLVELVRLVDSGTLSVSMAKTVLEECFITGAVPEEVVTSKGLSQINDSSVVEAAVIDAISNNPKAVEDYLNGKETAARFLVGQVMKITKGQAKPDLVQSLVVAKLEEN
jgi:aspartyl-tRNA(Asn)/glutamyl-tRNA(Gln) amidotransferase subunit B